MSYFFPRYSSNTNVAIKNLVSLSLCLQPQILLLANEESVVGPNVLFVRRVPKALTVSLSLPLLHVLVPPLTV